MPSRFLVFAASATLGALGAAAALAATSAHRMENADYQPQGKAVSCIVQSQIVSTRVLDDSNIDFVLPGRRVYRNHLPQPCPRLGFEQSFTHSEPNNNYCSGDMITVFSHATPGFPGATCILGDFQPMVRPARGS